MNNLKLLFTNLVKTLNPYDKPTKEYYEGWTKLMNVYDIDIVSKACYKLKTTWTNRYFPLIGNFKETCDEIKTQQTLEFEKRKTPEQRPQWHTSNLKELREYGKKVFNGITTRRQFLDEGVKHGIFNQGWSVEKYLDYYNKRGLDLDQPIGFGNPLNVIAPHKEGETSVCAD